MNLQGTGCPVQRDDGMDKKQRLQTFGNIHRILLQQSQRTRRRTGDENRNATIINVDFIYFIM